MKIRYTRAMLNAAMDGELDGVEYQKDPRFGFEIPVECPNVPSELLQPRNTWESGEEKAFSKEQFKDLVDLAESGLKDLFLLQKEVIKNE